MVLMVNKILVVLMITRAELAELILEVAVAEEPMEILGAVTVVLE